MEALWRNWHGWIWSAGILTTAIVLAFGVHRILFFVLRRLARRKGNPLMSSLVHHGQKPSAWLLPFLALLPALPATSLPEVALDPLERAAGIGLIAAIAWLVVLSTEVITDVLISRYSADAQDNLAARRLKTITQVVHHIVVTVVVIVALSIILMTFPAVKQIGMSLLASAGLAGLVVGMAMKSTLSSLIAGIQIAFSQPIRIEDSVVVEGEWGWIEEITTTFVVVRIWDLRRLVLPISYFIEKPFQNWTRKSADLLGTVFLYVDYTAPVDEVRQELHRLLQTTDLWDGKSWGLQVTNATDRALELRALMSASSSSRAWDLRCLIREGLVQFLQEHYPECLPKTRADVAGLSSELEQRRLKDSFHAA